MTETAEQQQQSDDERRLAELGYTQALQRSWSGFSNFAISFTIISVLAGCFTTYGQAWNNGGPIAISWGWPIICGLILLVAFSMSELVSAYPTAGGIYYWASTLGGPKWGWFTGWFNLVGLVGVVASVDYGCAQFLNATFMLFGVEPRLRQLGRQRARADRRRSCCSCVILTLHALINIYSSPLVALLQQHLRLLARGRRRGDRARARVRARHAPERRLRLHRDDQQLGLRRRDVLVLRAAARLPADDVHADRLRRVRAHLRGDARRGQGRGPGRLARGLLVGRRRLDRAAGDHVRRDRRGRDQRGRGRLARGLRDRAAGGLAEGRRA